MLWTQIRHCEHERRKFFLLFTSSGWVSFGSLSEPLPPAALRSCSRGSARLQETGLFGILFPADAKEDTAQSCWLGNPKRSCTS